MAITRPKTYKNFVPPDTGKAYQITGNPNGTSKITDVTEYISEGDNWTAADANMIWDGIEEAIREIEEIDCIPNSAKGAAGGVASLGTDGKVPESQLPELGSTNLYGTEEYVDKVTPLADGVAYFMYEE